MENWKMLLCGVTIVVALRLFAEYKIRAAKKNAYDCQIMSKDTYLMCEDLGKFGKTLDFSLESLCKTDEFLDEIIRENKLLRDKESKKAFMHMLFCLGCYLGDTIINEIKGSCWISQHPEMISKNVIKLPNGTILWPCVRVFKRVFNGPADSLYSYARGLVKSV